MDNIIRLHTVIGSLNQARVKWWIDHGTLLGIMRESRLLPWDPDIDISVFAADLGKVYAALAPFKARLAAHLIKTSRNIKVIPYQQNDKVIDISAYRSGPDNSYEKLLVEFPRAGRLKAAAARRFAWRKCRSFEKTLWQIELRALRQANCSGRITGYAAKVLIDRITTIREAMGVRHFSRVPANFFSTFPAITWRGLSLPAPYDPEAYLAFRYGKDWQTPQAGWKWWKDDKSIKLND